MALVALPVSPFAVTDRWVASSLLLSIRLVPLFSFTPPFTLTRVPRSVRALMSVGLAAAIAGGHPEAQLAGALDAANMVPAAAHELLIGLAMSVPLQLLVQSKFHRNLSPFIRSR